MGIQALGVLSGVNVINYYATTIYKLLGFSTGTSLQIVGIAGALSIVYCAIGLWLLDRVGRVKPMIVSSVGCALALCVNATLAKYYVVADDGQTTNANALRSMVAMYFVFSLSYTMIGESTAPFSLSSSFFSP